MVGRILRPPSQDSGPRYMNASDYLVHYPQGCCYEEILLIKVPNQSIPRYREKIHAVLKELQIGCSMNRSSSINCLCGSRWNKKKQETFVQLSKA